MTEPGRESTWQLARIFIAFIAAYASIHKLLLPLALKLTSLNGTPYARIQIGVVVPVSLAIAMLRADRLTRVLSALCGVAIVWGAYEVLEVSLGRHVGWFAISRLLSSVPIALAAIVLMSTQDFGRDLSAGWLGVLLFVTVVVGKETWARREHSAAPIAGAPSQKVATPDPIENLSCGAARLLVTGDRGVTGDQALTVGDCGLSPSILLLKEGPLRVNNRLARSLNLHLLVVSRTSRATAWNILIPATREFLTPPVRLVPGAIGLLYSDNFREGGISVIRPSHLEKSWLVERDALRAREIDR